MTTFESSLDPMTADAVAISAIIGVTEKILQRLPEAASRFGVFVSCGVGVLYAFAVRPEIRPIHWSEQVVRGLMLGLSASGGYAGMRAFIGGDPPRVK
ncbi:MAG TPA: hypothetical protein DEH78_14340 [Solibacterales bacterium]|nr:hypothetical protein [Bryobacterales bacterium]